MAEETVQNDLPEIEGDGFFRFTDGFKNRKVDKLKTSLMVADLLDKATIESAQMKDYASVMKIVEVTRKIFKIVEWDEDTDQGLNDTEVMKIFGTFILDIEGVKKNTEQVLNLQPSTEQAS